MNQSKLSSIFNLLLALLLMGLAGYLFIEGEYSLPGRYSTGVITIKAPASYLTAVFPLSISVALVLRVADAQRYKNLAENIFTTGVIALLVGGVIIAPFL
jgi:hypothetical protein